ncbi:MAG: ABC transporter substrate-binding protein [Chloroflexota bacterium]
MAKHALLSRLSLAMAGAVLASVLVAGCAQTAGPSSPAPANPAASSGQGTSTDKPGAGAPQEIKIGVLFPLSGSAAVVGLDCKYGADLAADVINGKNDFNMPLAKTEGLPNLGGAKIKLVTVDHQGVPEKGQSEAERLVTQEKVSALYGTYHSSVTMTASQAAERLGVPFVNGDSTSQMLTERGLKYFFRTGPHDGVLVSNFFNLLDDVQKQKGAKIKTIGIINENTLAGNDFNKSAKKFAQERGYQIVADILYPAGTSELSSEVQKLKSANPDVTFQFSYTSEAILFMKTMKLMDVNPQGIMAYGGGFVDPKFFEVLGKDSQYAISKAAWSLDMAEKIPMAKAVAQMYKQKFNQEMTENSARTFTGMIVLADAINRAKSADPKAIQAALQATDIPAEQLIVPWKGVKFGPDGQNVGAMGINTQVFNGQHYAVWPFNVAAKDLVWPRPKWSDLK